MKIRSWLIMLALLLTATSWFLLDHFAISLPSRIRAATAQGKEVVIDRGRKRMGIEFEAAKVAYPPQKVVLVYIKDEKRLDVYAGSTDEKLKRVVKYKVLAASGVEGPKLREGDEQVPEGIYSIEGLNPYSQFHLSLRVNYPSPDDRKQAKADGRSRLGGDIMIHGSSVSIGCIAIGDTAIEELFALAKDTKFRTWQVLLSPTDFRKGDAHSKALLAKSDWVGSRYREIAKNLNRLP